ncbi:MAG: site-specific recombinase XerC [Cellvibrionaceae bacterium]|jgi:site-specific recombinase XerC
MNTQTFEESKQRYSLERQAFSQTQDNYCRDIAKIQKYFNKNIVTEADQFCQHLSVHGTIA